ncbi:flagellar protein FlaG [Mesobacillus foraminis]|uniref:Flagellar protein FlaG n=1 Tax=Mesobacillus foraminis TaxID=279826 RepID=A0A4V2RE00_9BACI|nr:flagellar protein FlaG [Mesobacillus foraminis]TCN26750.1 flagellar protein FlaG [Mesobacillus foraminis]
MIDKLSSIHIPSQQSTSKTGVTNINTKEIESVSRSQEETEKNLNLSKAKVKEMVDTLNEFVQASDTSIKFQYHEKLHEYYVSIVDNTTNEVVREIPPKKMLDIYAAMTEFLGLMVDKKI